MVGAAPAHSAFPHNDFLSFLERIALNLIQIECNPRQASRWECCVSLNLIALGSMARRSASCPPARNQAPWRAGQCPTAPSGGHSATAQYAHRRVFLHHKSRGSIVGCPPGGWALPSVAAQFGAQEAPISTLSAPPRPRPSTTPPLAENPLPSKQRWAPPAPTFAKSPAPAAARAVRTPPAPCASR